MKICMAAPYDVTNARSWSGTPYSVYRALCAYPENQVEPLNLSAYHTPAALRRNMLRHLDAAASLRAGEPVSKIGAAFMNPLNSAILRRHCSASDYDALLEFGGFMPSPDLPPYYIYTDSSHDLSLAHYAQTGRLPFNNRPEDLEAVRRAAVYVRPIYRNAQGVFCMSRWLADTMVGTTGVDPERVHVVYAGANWHDEDAPRDVQPRTLRADGEMHLLLVGVSYKGKGVDLAAEALDLLNAENGVRYHLHVCGLQEAIPETEGLHNHGFVSKSTLRQLLRTCDLFVLPSRFDCFGISFVEAMTFGLPCVGRRLCAMPEIIDEGVNGELVDGDDPLQLAEKIRKICRDAATYTRYSAAAIDKAARFTWENTAGAMMQVFRRDGLVRDE